MYQGLYSLTFNKTMNTWTHWHLIPASPPVVPIPEAKLNLVEIPGLAQGALDLSTIPFNKMQYGRMSGNWEFLIDPDHIGERNSIVETVRAYLNGKTMFVQLTEQPEYLYKGVFVVGTPKIGASTTTLQIGYNLEPVRYLTSGESVDYSYP